MNSNNNFEVNICYYGAREKLVTHIKNVQELSTHLEMKPNNVRDYIATRLNTMAYIEDTTLKISGLLTAPIINSLMEEIRADI